MPDIIFPPDTNLEQARNVLSGHMHFPESSDRAFEVYVRKELQRLNVRGAVNTEPVELPAGWVKALLNGHSEKELNQGGQIRGRQGITAGLILWNMHAASTKRRTASLNDAIEILMQEIERRRAPLNLPSQPYRNKPEIHSAWKKMKSVAHLWAALCAVHASKAPHETLPPEPWASLMLGYSLAFQRWATAPQPTGEPPINSNDIWRLPEMKDVQAPDLATALPDEINPRFASLLTTKRRR